ncbi:TPA_exp: Uncharacterized protein A8136_5457 [Trichophyton benhamiae CBS 112371]|nr:TPA_exp: Uncharacterized protein A8136_5457 [Trichophyton benhamiae CBS 112371]
MWYSVQSIVCLMYCIVQVTAWSIPLRYLGVHTTLRAPITGRSASEETITHGAPPFQPPGITDNVRSAETTSYKDTMNGVTLERLLADLETCVEDLVPYSPEVPPNDIVQISGSKMRSCRQAIFTLIRWYRQSNPSTRKSSTEIQNERRDDQKSRFNLVKPGDNTDPRQTGSLQTTATGKVRPTQTSTRPLTCRELACPPGDLAATCVTKPGIKLKPTLAQMCRMCFPRRDERLIDEHCADESKKEWNIFYILFAILISISTAGFTLAIVRRLREKAQTSQNTASEVLPTKRFVDSGSTSTNTSPAEPMSRRVVSWLRGVVTYVRDSRARVDVEEHPELGVAAANSLIPTFVNQVNPNRPHPFQVSGAETCERQTGLKLRKSCDSSLDVPGKEGSPRARSSSVQATPAAVNEP